MPSGTAETPFDEFSTGEASFVVDESFRVIRWSDRATELLGFEKSDAMGKRCYELLNGVDARSPVGCGRDCPVLTGTRRNPEVPDYDMLSVNPEGEYRWLNITTLIRGGARRGTARGSKSPRQVMHLIRDVTDKRSVEEYARVSARAIRAAAATPLDVQADAHKSGQKAPGSPGLEDTMATVGDMSPSNVPQLSRRELQVLRLLSHGASTKEMAETLGVAPVTARNHVSRLLIRLGVGTRLQAVVYGARAGLI